MTEIERRLIESVLSLRAVRCALCDRLPVDGSFDIGDDQLCPDCRPMILSDDPMEWPR